VGFPSGSAHACEPIIPLAQLIAGPGFVAASVLWWTVAVGSKCVAFALLEKRLSRAEAAWCLLVGNLISTIPGILVGAAAANPPVMVLGLPLVFVMSLLPARRLSHHLACQDPPRNLPPFAVAGLCTLGVVGTWILFIAAAAALGQRSYFSYWALKYAYVTVAMAISLGLTVLWEEAVVARLTAARHPGANYLSTVLRANYVAFGLVLAIAAVQMLPQRWGKPGFVTGQWVLTLLQDADSSLLELARACAAALGRL
jgi:hypothetical protein